MKFIIDAKEEARNIPYLVKNLSGERIIQPKVLEKVKLSGEFVSEERLISEIRKFHLENKEKISKNKRFFSSFWKKVGKRYTSEIEKVLEMKTNKNKIIYFAPSIYGIADVLGRKNIFIGLEWEKELDYLFLHELTHLHYSDKIIQLGGWKLFHKAAKSPLMEGIDHLIIFKTPIKDLIESDTRYENIGFVIRNRNFMRKLEKLWEERKNFKSFLKEAIKLNEKTRGVIIC